MKLTLSLSKYIGMGVMKDEGFDEQFNASQAVMHLQGKSTYCLLIFQDIVSTAKESVLGPKYKQQSIFASQVSVSVLIVGTSKGASPRENSEF